MDTAGINEMREEVKKFIDHADDKMVRIFYSIMEGEQEDDWWDKLPPGIKNEIDEAITDLDNGNGMQHEDVLKKYSKWFTR